MTRLVVDKEWDARVWEESWQGKEIEKELVEILTRSGLLGDEEEASGIKRKTTTQDRPAKKRRVIPGSEESWGEEVPTQDEEKLLFLYEKRDVPIKGGDTKQTILKPLVGTEEGS